jgi:hypothetical protein
MQDTANHASIIDARLARLAARKMRRNHSPSLIRQPEQIPHLALRVASKPKERLIRP